MIFSPRCNCRLFVWKLLVGLMADWYVVGLKWSH